MSKKELFRSLTSEQRQAVEDLLDKAYLNGYESGTTEERVVSNYERFW